MNHNHISSLEQQAMRQIEYGDNEGAINTLKEALSLDPDNAFCHSLLAIVLLDQKRLYAAKHEASIGLELNPEEPFGHYAMGQILKSDRKFKQALQHFERAIDLDHNNPHFIYSLGDTYSLLQDHKKALACYEEALSLAPDSPDCLDRLGNYYLDQGDSNKAQKYFHEGLEALPSHPGCLIGIGHVFLNRGQIEEARDHAIWALQNNASDESALRLMVNIKARTNKFLSLWWRLNTWAMKGNQTRSILILLGMYLCYRVSAIFLETSNLEEYSALLNYLWIGFVVYTWVSPSLFQKSLKKELETVQLKHDF